MKKPELSLICDAHTIIREEPSIKITRPLPHRTGLVRLAMDEHSSGMQQLARDRLLLALFRSWSLRVRRSAPQVLDAKPNISRPQRFLIPE